MKLQQKSAVIKLRKTGLSFSEIQNHLGISIPKSTISSWCRNVKMSHVGTKRHSKSSIEKNFAARQAALKANKRIRGLYFEKLDTENKYLLDQIKDPLCAKVALAMLYLGEGGKTNGSIVFGNADPNVICLFLKLMRKTYKLDEAKFRCTVQCRADQPVQKLERFWSHTCQIPYVQFYKVQIDPRTRGIKTRCPDYKGVCRIDYLSANVFNDLRSAINVLMGC